MMYSQFILCLLLPACHALSFTSSENEVEIGVTANVSLTCHYDRSENLNIQEIIFLRILKMKVNETSWKPMIELRDTDDLPRIVGAEDVFASGKVGRQVKEKEKETNSFLKVTWAVAESKTIGRYRCDMTGWNDEHDTVSTKSPLLEIKERSSLTSLQLYDLLLQAETGLNSKLENSISDVKRDLSVLKETNLIIITWFQQYWPEGSYGLHYPSTGCPSHIGVIWVTGSRYHHTESSSRNHDKLSDRNHFGSIMHRSGVNNLIQQSFCMVTSRSVGPLWPKGSYCIARKENVNVPDGFTCGWLQWQDENVSPASSFSGQMPFGDYPNLYTTIHYCCRRDQNASTPMYLPTSKPFYLYRYGGTCQQIHGMNVQEEYILFDTDDRGGNKGSSPHPDALITPDIKLELCYYSKI